MYGANLRGRVVSGVLSDLLIRVCRSQGFPRSVNEPLPGSSGDESLSKFDGSDHRFDVEVSRQKIGIDDGRIEWIRAPEFDLSTYPKVMRVEKSGEQNEAHLREVGEMRLEAIVIQLPSGSGNPDTHPFAQMIW